jgi:hypothetical protein
MLEVAGRADSPIPFTAFDITTRGMRPSKTVGAASEVDCGLINCSRRMVLVKSGEQALCGIDHITVL